MSGAARLKPILPWWQLGLLLVACVLGIWFLVPDDPGLLDDLVRDGNAREARRLLESLSSEERARDARRLRAIELRIARMEIKSGDPESLTRFWAQAATAWRDSQFSGEIFLEFAPLIPRLPDPAAAWTVIAADVPAIPARLRTRLVDEFTRAALAAGQSAPAAAIYAAGHPADTRSPEHTLELARLWQLAGRPADALDALGARTEPALIERRVELLRELNRNREAFALLRARAETFPDRIPDATLADQLANTALAAGVPADAAPLLSLYLGKNPADLPLQRRLRDLLTTSGQNAAALAPARQAVELGARQPADVRQLATLLEYTGQGEQAFDLWLELALQGDLPAVDRLVALNPGVYRDDDLRRALERVVPVPGHDDYTLKLAQLEVVVGRYEHAGKYFEQYLATEPRDTDALIEYANLHYELYRFSDAEKWLRRASVLLPADMELREQIGETLVLQNRTADALDYFATLARESPTEEVLGQYARLAESLGRYEEFTRALRLLIEHVPARRAHHYRLLAYAYDLAGEPEKRVAALEEGIRHAEGSDDLTLQLAFAFTEEKNYRAAQTALQKHGGLRTDAGAAMLYLDLMRLNNDTAAERLYLAEPLAPAFTNNEAILERVARSREALGDYAEAERLWRALYEIRPTDFTRAGDLARLLMTRGHPVEAHAILAPFLHEPAPPVLKLSAEIASAAGDYKAAERYQLAYLEKFKTAGATDWGALGDIRLSRGDREGAKRAYAEALRRMHAQIRLKAAP